MRTKFIASLIVVAAVSTACGTKSASGFPTPQKLSDALLTVTDMPSGWSESQRDVFTTRAPENPSIDPSIWCSAASTSAKNLVTLAGNSGADVEMSFAMGSGPNRMMRLQAWSNADVSKYFSAAAESVHTCDGASWTDSDGASTTDVVIPGHTIGDQSISWSETVTPPAGTGKDKFESLGRTTIARFGNILMVLQLGDAAPVGTGTLMADADWWAIVEKAGTKLLNAAK
jgi:hypothetical protein